MLDRNLINQGVTAEDLEKATSVRLFEKAAAAQGIDLNQFSDISEKMPNTGNGEYQMDAVEIFEKVAEAEGIELDTLEDEQLAGLFNHFVENVLPEMIAAEEGEEVSGTAYGSDDADIEEAQMKLAEAEILGRHMARAFADEQEKLAGMPRNMDEAVAAGKELLGNFKKKTRAQRIKSYLRANAAPLAGAAAVGGVGTAAGMAAYKKRKSATKTASILEKLAEAESMSGKVKRLALRGDMKAQELGKYLAGIGSGGAGRGGVGVHRTLGYGAPAVATAGLAYGGKKLYDRSHKKQASFAELEELAQERAFEALIEARAEEILSELE